MQKEGKQGFKYKPKTTIKVGLLVVGQLRDLNNTIYKIYNIIHSNVSAYTPLLCYARRTHTNCIYLS